MTTEEAMLSDLLDGDDAARQALAGWLSDHGEPRRGALLAHLVIRNAVAIMYRRIVNEWGCAGTWREFLSVVDTCAVLALAAPLMFGRLD